MRLIRVRFYCMRRLINTFTVQYFFVIGRLKNIHRRTRKKGVQYFCDIHLSFVSARWTRKNIVASKTLYLNNNFQYWTGSKNIHWRTPRLLLLLAYVSCPYHTDHFFNTPHCIEKQGVFCVAPVCVRYMVSGAPHAYQMHAQI